ncbi:MAG: hypothetical protein ABW019_06525 [Chitinophagaceae bacterium]
MSSEKQNNGWKDNLLAWESTGGDVTHADEQLWEKLQTRLQPRPSRRNVYLLRAAAILVLLAGSFLLWQTGRPHADLPASRVTKTGSGTPVADDTRTTNEKKAALPRDIAAAPLPLKTGPYRATAAADTAGSNLASPGLPVRDTSLVLADAPVPVITPAAGGEPSRQKKLKIVHMNEWNAPPPPAYAAQKDRQTPLLADDPEDRSAGPSFWPGKNKNRMLSASRN